MSARTVALGIAKWVGITLGVILLLVIGTLVFFMTTTAGARTAINFGVSKSPYPVQVASIGGSLRGPLTLTGIEVDYEGVRAKIDEFVFDWRPLAIVRRDLIVDQLHVTGIDVVVPEGWKPPEKAEAEEPPSEPGPPAVPELPIEIMLEDLRVEIARVLLEGQGELRESVLSGHGSLDAFEFVTELHGAAAQVEAFDARFTLDGAPDAYNLGGHMSMTSAELPPVTASLASNGSLKELSVTEAHVETANGTADLTADVAWYPEIVWNLLANADGLEVAAFLPDPEEWPGAVSFRAESSGSIGDAGPEAAVLVSDIGGELRGQPLGGGIDARVSPGHVDVNELAVTWGSLELDAEGALAETLTFTFDFEAPDLGAQVPGAGGAVRASGELSGTRTEPKLSARFEANELALDSMRLANAQGVVDFDFAPGAVNHIEVRARSFAQGATTVDSLAITADGTREEHSARVAAWIKAEDRVGLVASGGLDEEQAGDARVFSWSGSLDSLSISMEQTGAWALRAAAPVFASADTASIADACLVQEPAALCLDGAWSKAGAAAGELRIEALPLAVVAGPGLPDGTTIDGTLEGDARFALETGGAITADGEFRADGEIASELGDQPARFTLGGDGLTFAVDAAGSRMDALFTLQPEAGGGAFEVTANVTLPGYNSTTIPLDGQSIEGSFEVVSEDLSFLSSFNPAVSEAEGRMHLEGGVSGTAAEPAVRGALVVEDGRFVIPELGLDLTETQINAEGDPDGGITLSGSVHSGEGSFEIEGRVPVQPSPEQPGEIRMRGERFLAVNTTEAAVIIEPDLDISFDSEVITVRGRVAVPFADVELVEVPPSAVAPSADVVFVGEETPPPPDVDVEVEVVVGDSVSFDGMGFTSMIAGDMRIRQLPGEAPTILGELSFIDGRYAAYGQNLDIDPGRVVFTGPVGEISLDVTAVREASDGTLAGLMITGSALEPDIVLTSDPAQTDADVLSYIMYGTPMSDGDEGRQQTVAGAAATLGANVVTTKLAGSVGLDEARVEGTTRDEAELVAGKYLTPKIYISYGMGLFKPSSTFRVKYLLSSNWALQAESGDANGGDVMYQIETGK